MYEKNDEIRIVDFDELDEKNQIFLMSFFRRIGLPHIYWERVIPTFQTGHSLIVAAVMDRPWPPWGSGSQKILALSHAYPKDENNVYLSAIYVSNKDLTNIGMMSAIYKEMLQNLLKRERLFVNYVVREDSILARRVLVDMGFKNTEELYLTEEARYNVYSVDAQNLLKRLGLSEISTVDLLKHNMDNMIFEKAIIFHETMQLATRLEPHEVLAKPDGGVPNGKS